MVELTVSCSHVNRINSGYIWFRAYPKKVEEIKLLKS